MFAKLSVATLLLPFIHALTLNTPTGLTSGGTATITWTSVSGDPPFTLELANPVFRDALAIANNIDPTTRDSITLMLPAVPVMGGYTLQAVNVTDIGDVYAESGEFSIGPTTSTTTTTGTLSTISTSATTTRPFTTTTALSGSGSNTATVPATTSSSAATPLKFVTTGIVGPLAALLLSAFAGVAVVAL